MRFIIDAETMSYLTQRHFITYHLLETHPEIIAFSTTRHGGCSKGTYATFNCTVHGGDSEKHAARNLHALSRLFPEPPKAFVIPHQCHRDSICLVNTPDIPSELEGIDAVVTAVPRICACASTADCVPVLLYDPVKKVVAAVHSGWRGTVIRIVETVIQTMRQHYACDAKDILACIGPSISVDAFEVGDEVYEAFRNAGFDMNTIARHDEKWHIDLWEANRQILLDQGVGEGHTEISGICTYTHSEDFFSARRLGNRSGRILNGIMLL